MKTFPEFCGQLFNLCWFFLIKLSANLSKISVSVCSFISCPKWIFLHGKEVFRSCGFFARCKKIWKLIIHVVETASAWTFLFFTFSCCKNVFCKKIFYTKRKLIKNLSRKSRKDRPKPRKPSSPQKEKPVEWIWFNLIKLFISLRFISWLRRFVD